MRARDVGLCRPAPAASSFATLSRDFELAIFVRSAGEGVDMGEWGGSGIGCLGALGESGRPGMGTPRGDNGGEFTGGLNAPGRGLAGKPGLRSGAASDLD